MLSQLYGAGETGVGSYFLVSGMSQIVCLELEDSNFSAILLLLVLMFGLEAEDEDFKPADVDGEVVLERFHGGVINFF